MTVSEICQRVTLAGKPLSRERFYFHARRLKLKPKGDAKQCPAQWQDDSPDLILASLGFTPNAGRLPNRRRHPRRKVRLTAV